MLTDHFWSSCSGLMETGTRHWWQLLLKVRTAISGCHHGHRGSVGSWERCLMLWQLPGMPVTALVAHVATWDRVTSTSLAGLVGLGEVRTSPRRDSGWPEPLLEAQTGKFPNTELWGQEGALGAGIWRCLETGNGRRAAAARLELGWGSEQREGTQPPGVFRVPWQLSRPGFGVSAGWREQPGPGDAWGGVGGSVAEGPWLSSCHNPSLPAPSQPSLQPWGNPLEVPGGDK